MSSGASTNPPMSFGPIGTSSIPAASFQSPDPSSSSAAYGTVGGFPTGFGRMKSEATAYAYDEQAPRSQQHTQGNYTHHDLSGNGSLAQTQAMGGFNSSTSQQYTDSRSALGQSHYMPGHTRHQSLNSGVSQLGLGSGNNAYSFGDVNSSQYSNYNLVTTQRSPSGRLSGFPAETSPTRSRFTSTGYTDQRSGINRPPSRTMGLGVSITPGQSSDDSIKNEGGSPRSLKRAADHVEDLRSSSEHSQLRRPASFPVLGTAGANTYGRSMPQDARNVQSMGRRAGRGVMGQLTPGRSNALLPGLGGGYFEADGRRESMGSSATMQSPAPYGGSGSSEELGLGGTMPQLIRATQIPGAVTPGQVMTPSDPMYSPPAASGGSPRAKLELHGNLNDMAVGWSHDEWRTGRRLVQFWRRQDGTNIHATFRPILPSQYVPNSIVISCIFREDKNECFVTSVDTIYLLEALVASRFTVEEKNRIRRNLEGFRPITVSKNKRECERFFKLIMSFPNPKPRNIEKDVKVFPWKVLASALCKIIGKYSASYDGGLPILSDLGDPSFGVGAGMGAAMPGVDLSGGHYRDSNYASPSMKDARLSDPSFDYDRQGGSGSMYGVTNAGMHHSGGYGSSNWGVGGGQAMSFNGGVGYTGASAPVSFPSQSSSSSHGHGSGAYDSFGAAQQSHGGDASGNLYDQSTTSQNHMSGVAADVKPSQQSLGQSSGSSTLAGATSDYYSSDRRV